ncbi:hypothetical protein GY631_7580 [Trichophyton interdigitale]|nr:hypothetical protein GY631_7580 [Trichophyton interdigitale]
MLGRRRNRASRRKSGIQVRRLLRWLRLWLWLRLLLLRRLLRSWIVSDRRGIRDRRRHCSHWRRSTGHSDVFHSALLPLFVARRCSCLCALQAVSPGDDIVLEQRPIGSHRRHSGRSKAFLQLRRDVLLLSSASFSCSPAASAASASPSARFLSLGTQKTRLRGGSLKFEV